MTNPKENGSASPQSQPAQITTQQNYIYPAEFIEKVTRRCRDNFKPQNIPAELKAIKGWVVWKAGKKKKPHPDKFDKKPYYPSGQIRIGDQGNAEDKARLGTFDEALKAFQDGPQFAGLGLAMLPDWGLTAFDGDECMNDKGGIDADVDELTQGTYTEVSPSGKGIRAFFTGTYPTGKKGNREIYSGTQFLTVTGDALDETRTLRDLDEVRPMLGKMFAKPETVKPAPALLKVNGPLMDDLRSALEYLNPDPYDEWMATGMALTTTPIEPLANALYHEWSAKSNKYSYAECQAKWESFKDAKTSYKAIFRKAQELGWVNPASGRYEFDFTGLFGKVDSETGQIGPLLKPVSVIDVLSNPSPPPKFVWDGYIPRGVVTMLGAHGGTGKSTIGLMLGVCAAIGRPLFGAEVEPCKVLFVSLEDSGAIARHRLANICKLWSIDPLALVDRLHIVDGTEYPELFSAENRGAGLLTATYREMSDIVQAEGIGLVIVDNASDAYGGDEIQRRQVRAFIRALVMVIKPTNAGCLLLAHVDKNTSKARKAEGGEGYSGSTAWHNSARSRLFLTRGEDDLLTIEHQKSNLGRMREPIKLEWAEDGLPKLVEQSGLGDFLSSVTSNAQGERAKALLTMVAEFEDRHHYCSPIPTARNNVHATLSSEPDFKKLKLSKPDCRHILNQCQRNKWLEIVDFLDAYRKPRQRWSLTGSGRAFAGVSAPSAPSCDEDAESEQGVKAAPSAPCA
jgi:hypothetical protein